MLRNEQKYDFKSNLGKIILVNLLEKYNLTDFLDEFNRYGGVYKHRWNNGYILDLFLRTYFNKPIYNLNLIKKGFVETKIEGSENFIYWGYRDAYNSLSFRLLLKIKNFIKKIFFI